MHGMQTGQQQFGKKFGEHVPPQAIVASVPASPPKPPRRKRAKAQAQKHDSGAYELPPMISPLLTLATAPSTCDAGIIEGRELRKMRKRLRLSQGEFGAELGLTDRTISHYDTDRRRLPLEMYTKLYDLLDPAHPTAIAIIDAKTHQLLRVI